MKEHRGCINGTETKITNTNGEVRYPYARILIRRRPDWQPKNPEAYAEQVEELKNKAAKRKHHDND